MDHADCDVQNRYQSLFEEMPVGVFYQDPDGTLIDVNRAALEMFGLSRDQLLGRTSYHPEWRVIDENGTELPPERHPSMVALRTGKPVANAVAGVYSPERGDFTWLRITAIPQFIPGEPAPCRVFVTLLDITERKRTEDIMSARLRLQQFATTACSMEKLLQATLDEAEKLTGSSIGFYHHFSEEQQALTLQAWSTRTMTEFCRAEGNGLHYPLAQAGVWVDCISERRPVIHNDYASLPHRRGMPEGHADVVRELVVPVFRDEKIVAIIGVGNKPVGYHQQDVEAVSLLADLSWDITARMSAESRLQESAELFRTLTETTSDGFWVADKDGRIVEVNDAACRIYGYERDELLGKSLRDFEEIEKEQETFEHVQRIIANRFERFETRHRCRDGSVIDVEVSTTFIPAKNQFLAFLHGVTDLKRSEKALRDSELLLREAQRVGHLGTYDYDIPIDRWRCSPELDRIFGIDESFPRTFNSWLTLVHPDHRARMDQYFSSLHRSRTWFDMEYPILRPVDGAERWLYGTGEFTRDDVGNPIRMIGTIQDITERKSREIDSLRMLQALIDLARNKALYAVQLPVALATITEAAAEALGTWRVSVWFYSDDHEGIVCSDMFDLGQRHHSQGDFLKIADFPSYFAAAATGEVIAAHDAHNDPRTAEFTERFLFPNGITSLLNVPILAEGQVLGVVCHEHAGPARNWTLEEQSFAMAVGGFVSMLVEMNQRRNAEAEFRRLNEKLEQRVAERTAQLEAINRELESFCYSVSHDLRAPLRHIGGFSRMLLDDHEHQLDPHGIHCLQRIAAGVEKMQGLIDDLLALSRVNRAELHRQKLNLSTLVRELATELKNTCPERDVEIVIADGIETQADPGLMRVALDNLVHNAFKYTGRRDHAVIEFGSFERVGENIFFIRDNGAGFDMAGYENLFGVFRRLHRETEFPGTGVGLATVQRIIRRHGGRIWAEGMPDAGATFYFTLH